jgi:hypothetical protein
MHTLNAPIGADGILLDILVGHANANVLLLRRSGRPIPAAVALRALVDTGAEISCVDQQALAPLVAQGLQLGRIVLANLPAAGGLSPTREFVVSLTLLHPSNDPRANLVLRNQPVMEQSLGSLGYQALIGRDVLDRCLHWHNGPDKLFTLVY